MTFTALTRTRLIAAAVGVVALPGFALAAQVDTPRIGSAASLRGQVTAVIDHQPSHAVKTAEEVFGGERIHTGPGSSIVVEFLDNSTFQIGANADVVVNPSQVQPVAGATVRSVQINSGPFRSITALGSSNSQTIISTSVGAFTSSAAVVVGEVTQQRVVIFPIDGPGTFVYSARSLSVPKGGALVADLGTGEAHTIQTAASDPAVSALMADSMTQLGGGTPLTAASHPGAPMSPMATAAGVSTPVGYVTQPTGTVAGITTTSDGYIDATGGTDSKCAGGSMGGGPGGGGGLSGGSGGGGCTPPETQVANTQQPPAPPVQPPPAGPNVSPPPLPPIPPASPL